MIRSKDDGHLIVTSIDTLKTWSKNLCDTDLLYCKFPILTGDRFDKVLLPTRSSFSGFESSVGQPATKISLCQSSGKKAHFFGNQGISKIAKGAGSAPSFISFSQDMATGPHYKKLYVFISTFSPGNPFVVVDVVLLFYVHG